MPLKKKLCAGERQPTFLGFLDNNNNCVKKSSIQNENMEGVNVTETESQLNPLPPPTSCSSNYKTKECAETPKDTCPTSNTELEKCKLG